MTLYADLNRSGEISRTLSHLQKLTVLYVLSSSGHWHQRFERALSWDMLTWCSLSRQKFNTPKWILFQLPSYTSSSEYSGNTKILKIITHHLIFTFQKSDVEFIFLPTLSRNWADLNIHKVSYLQSRIIYWEIYNLLGIFGNIGSGHWFLTLDFVTTVAVHTHNCGFAPTSRLKIAWLVSLKLQNSDWLLVN